MHFRLLIASFAIAFAAAPAFAQSSLEQEPAADPAYEGETAPPATFSDDEFVEDVQESQAPAGERETTTDEFVDETRPPEDLDEEVGEAVVPTKAEREKREPGNLSLMLGLGIANFRGDIANNVSVGPSWDLRGGFRNKNYIGGELAYVGTAHGVSDESDDDLGRNADGTAVASMGDALVRFNGTRDAFVQPFVAGGLGVFSLDVRDENTTVDRGTTLSLPVAAGVDVYATERLVFGGRFNYRILTEVFTNDIPGGDQWNFGLNVGATF